MEKKEHNISPNGMYVVEMVPEEKKYERPLILVHGSFGGSFMWNMIGEALVGLGYHCYALSLRGHKPNSVDVLAGVGMQDYADDVAHVVEAFSLEAPVVIGHSMSGLVALMYGATHPVSAVVSIGPSPSAEVQGEVDEAKIADIPDVYTPIDAGMPGTPEEAMQALPDVPQEVLMKMKDMLGPESGKARRDRKRGITISKEHVTFPYLVLAGEHADSVKFGVKPASSKKMAEYYGGTFKSITGATHPGILMGVHSGETAMTIHEWLGNV